MEKPQLAWSRNQLHKVVHEHWMMRVNVVMRTFNCDSIPERRRIPKNVQLSMALLALATSKDYARTREKLLTAHPSGWNTWKELRDTMHKIRKSANSSDSDSESDGKPDSDSDDESDSDTDDDAHRNSVPAKIRGDSDSESNSDTDNDAPRAARGIVYVANQVQPAGDNAAAGIQAITTRIAELERANTKLQSDKTELQRQKRNLKNAQSILKDKVLGLTEQNSKLKRKLQTEAHNYREATAKLSTQIFAAIDFPGPLERYIADYLPAGLRDQYYKNRNMMKRAGGGRKTDGTGAGTGGRASKKRRRTDEDEGRDENVEE